MTCENIYPSVTSHKC